jgi:anti-sigma regulatory factor (Ser/Thr protein kinase)
MTYRFATHFTFLNMLAMARRGRFDPARFQNRVELDFSDLKFAGPGAMACIKALLARQQLVLPPEDCFPVQHCCQDTIRYLSQMDFFTSDIRWRIPPEQEGFIGQSPAGRFLPIRNLHQLSETNAVSREMVRGLRMEDRKSALTIQYAISELIDNALQHSGSPSGAFVTAQKHQEPAMVHVLIVDTGIGIRRHLMKHPRFRQLTDDMAALKAALTPFVTGTYMARLREDRLDYENQGLGLSVTDQIARHSGGALYVWSGHALYRSRRRVQSMPVAWPGTIVFLTLPINPGVNPTDIVRGFDEGLHKKQIQLKFNS